MFDVFLYVLNYLKPSIFRNKRFSEKDMSSGDRSHIVSSVNSWIDIMVEIIMALVVVLNYFIRD